MARYMRVEGYESLVRDVRSNAIINDNKFLNDFSIDNYSIEFPTVFEQLDALHVKYDEMKQLHSSSFNSYSATAVCYHYYRKFRFWIMFTCHRRT